MMKQSRTRLIDVFGTLAEEVHSIFTALIESSVAEDMGSLKFENTILLDFRAVTPLAPAVRAAAVSAGPSIAPPISARIIREPHVEAALMRANANTTVLVCFDGLEDQKLLISPSLRHCSQKNGRGSPLASGNC